MHRSRRAFCLCSRVSCLGLLHFIAVQPSRFIELGRQCAYDVFDFSSLCLCLLLRMIKPPVNDITSWGDFSSLLLYSFLLAALSNPLFYDG